MTYYSAVMEMPALADYPQASSPAASSVREQVQNTLARFYTAPRNEHIGLEIVNLLEPEEAATDQMPVDLRTVQAALAFVRLLPRALPAPEIAADPDGEIAFDWLGPTGKMFSVSISSDGRIAYAGRFSSTSKIHGTEQLSQTLPQEVVRGIQKAVR